MLPIAQSYEPEMAASQNLWLGGRVVSSSREMCRSEVTDLWKLRIIDSRVEVLLLSMFISRLREQSVQFAERTWNIDYYFLLM